MKIYCVSRSEMFGKVPYYSSSIHKSKFYFDNSFSYDAPKLWNDLPLGIPTASVYSFIFQKATLQSKELKVSEMSADK